MKAQEPMNADRAMPSVNEKKGGGKGFLVFAFVLVIFVSAAAGAAWYTMNKFKAKDKDKAEAKSLTQEAPAVKLRKFGEPDAAMPPVQADIAPAAPQEMKVPAIAGGTESAAPIGIRGKPTEVGGPKKPGPRLDGAPSSEMTAIKPQPAPAGPSPYDSGFVVNGGMEPGGSKKTSGAGLGLPSGAGASIFGGAGGSSGEGKGALQGMLTPTSTPTVKAGRINNRSLMASEGTTAECVLRTKIVANLPGMVLCKLATPIYSANSKVVLAERGSIVTGEQSGQLKQGQSRMFVLWRRIETPEGVTIKIDAPVADQLGGAGIDGDLDNKWPQRIGAALMLSVISDVFAYQTAKDSGGSGASGTALQGTQASGKSIAEKVLDSTINIPPTLTRNQGDKILIMIPRDLDFSSVYDVQTK